MNRRAVGLVLAAWLAALVIGGGLIIAESAAQGARP